MDKAYYLHWNLFEIIHLFSERPSLWNRQKKDSSSSLSRSRSEWWIICAKMNFSKQISLTGWKWSKMTCTGQRLKTSGSRAAASMWWQKSRIFRSHIPHGIVCSKKVSWRSIRVLSTTHLSSRMSPTRTPVWTQALSARPKTTSSNPWSKKSKNRSEMSNFRCSINR